MHSRHSGNLLSDAVTSTSYTDAAYSTQAAGIYQYTVKAVYTGENVSDVRFTNTLTKDMLFTVNVNVTTNSGESANGAIVTLTHHDGNPAHVYTGTVTEGTTAFTGVWRGNYDILVTLAGFENFGATGIAVEAAVEYPVELTEVIEMPFNLEVTPTGNPENWMFSWNNLFPAERIAYWSEDYATLQAVMQNANMGYGVIFDLESYPVAAIDTFEFYHIPAGEGDGYTGIYDYKVYVVDISTGYEIYVSNTLQTTGNSKWEKFVLDGTNFGGKEMAIYIEPLTSIQYNVTTNINHPLLCGDGITTNAHSCMFNMGNGQVSLIGTQGGTFGEYLANLWIDINGEKTRVAGSAKALTGYEVYLDGVSKGTTTGTQHEFTGLTAGSYTAGVKSVYTSGASEMETVEFTVTVTATANTGYTFVNWTENGNSVSANAEYTFTVTGDRTLVANFTEDGNSIAGNTLTGITVYGNANSVCIVNKNNIHLKSVQIIDALGRVVYDGKASSSITIPVNGASGIYVVKLLSDDNKISSTKVILTR